MKKQLITLLILASAATLFGAGRAPQTYVCSLTKKTVSPCCCKQTNDGKLYCTLAKKTIDACCCKSTTKSP